MPHQCLQCGNAFAEGSKDLLRGCPGCGGTRFFFTQSALEGEALAEKREEAKHDLRAVVQAILSESASPADAVRRLQQDGVLGANADAVSESLVRADAVSKSAPAAAREPESGAPRVSARPDVPERPETVTIGGAGEYEIDVESLMNASPIVIQKDGVFMIHLPSVFDGNAKSRGKRRA